MACLIDSGYTLGCRDSMGGVKSVLIGTFNGAAAYTFDTDGNITATTSTVTYHTFEQAMETASFNQNGVYSTENGTIYFDQITNLTFHKNDAALRNKLIVLSQANMSVIIKDQRDEYWLVGISNGVRTTAGAMNTGKAYGDMNGVTVTLQGKEALPAYRIDDITIFTIG
tara:strand:+ start:4714 stop:5220 length:507 start_codon:yes stop_codon:yes gene_type:complete